VVTTVQDQSDQSTESLTFKGFLIDKTQNLTIKFLNLGVSSIVQKLRESEN
jgi:hypothetical protein